MNAKAQDPVPPNETETPAPRDLPPAARRALEEAAARRAALKSAGPPEFNGRGGTIPQRLLLMNGNLVKEKTRDELFNAANLIAGLAPNDRAAVETAYLIVLTRTPTAPELTHFESRLAGSKGKDRAHLLEDLYWALINVIEFSWNH